MKQFIGIYDGTMTEEDLKQVLATKEQDGLMSKEDKIKLDSLTSGEGGSGTIESIEASKVVQDASHRFVSDTQISTWDSKAGTTTATGATDGLMSKEDKTKLDGIAESANKYTHPENHPATMITEDETHRFVTDAEKATWNTSSTKESIGLGNVTNDAQVKRSEMGVADGVATLDSTGKVPAAQLPSFVDDVTEYDNFEAFPETGESGKIYVDKATNKTYRWSGSAYVDIPASIALGETSSTAYPGNKGKANADEIAKIKDGTTIVPKAGDAATVSGFTVGVNVPADAKFTDTVYTHPDNHDATMITEDETHRFVTDAEKNIWNAKADKIAATIEANGLMSAADKTKLDGIEAGANKYTHPANHAATMITEDTDHKFVTDAQIAAWTAKASTDVATGEANGLMLAADKTKLDGIAVNANNYVHPDDESHRHVSDTQISTWDAKADATLATTDEDGLMSSGDKEKLDGIEAEANKYEHPANHPATMITEDETHRFVTDTDKVAWTNKAEKTAATTEADGLMSSTDKTKLDGIAANANNYVHPDDTNTKHVSEAQIAAWNAKASTDVATGEANGLMLAADKTKLDGIAENANKYTHPENHPATMITEDETHRFVTDEEKAAWNTSATKESIGLGNVTNDAQVKRSEMGIADGVATLDSTGKVPTAQLPSFVDDVVEVENYEALPETGESGKIYIDKATNTTYRWSGTQYVDIPASIALGETSSTAYPGNKGKANADEIAKIKDGTIVVPKATDATTVTGFTVGVNVPADAKFTDTVYTHPDNHDATMITEDETHRFVTDAEKNIWNAKADKTVVTTDADGLMSAADKTKLDGIAENANNYTHPENHPATMITEDSEHRFVTDTEKSVWSSKADNTAVTTEANGLMSKEDKSKLDGIATGANNYVHPDNHPASMITEDETHRFVTDTDKASWANKAEKTAATIEADGLMSKDDKEKLDGIAENANNYTHPQNHPATMITEDTTHKFVTDAQIAEWTAKPADKEAIGLGNVTNDAQVKRSEMGVADGVATLDSTGKVPAAQLPSFVDDVVEVENYEALPETGEAAKIYVTTDTNKTYRWAGAAYAEIPTSIALGETASTAYAGDKGKAVTDEVNKIKDGTTVVPKATDATTITGFTVGVNVPADAKFTDTTYVAATTEANGLMSKEDKTKLDGIEAEANKYEHPANHAATMITEDESHRFVTDTEKNTWNTKASTDVATGEANGLMLAADKEKLDGIEAGANKYTHPANHAATMITEDTDHKFVTDAQIAAWTAKADTAIATTEANGLMSKEDKTKLDGIAANANNYVHPDDTNTKHVSEAQIAAWTAKAENSVATTGANGLMASTDKTKLDSIEEGANKYTHPDNHDATMITEDETHRFVTDTEKSIWNNKADKTLVSTDADGLMSAADKAKLDGLDEYAKYSELATHEFPELQTTSKTIIGAINELKQAIDTLQSAGQ